MSDEIIVKGPQSVVVDVVDRAFGAAGDGIVELEVRDSAGCQVARKFGKSAAGIGVDLSFHS
jgi:hypothetical protein